MMHANNATAKLLLAAGADVNATDNNARTPLVYATWRPGKKTPELVKVLLDAGVEVNSKDKLGWTPLMHAAEEERVEIVKLLLAAGADVNARANKGETALSISQKQERGTVLYKQIIALLKKAGAIE